LIDILIAQTLDDLDEGRVTIEAALHAIARVAWAHGRRQLQRDTGAPPPTESCAFTTNAATP
jgi:hypothetical protein